ncbi:MAG: acetyltransferase [Saprospiraceae bacterium]|jgi:acetyltransferase
MKNNSYPADLIKNVQLKDGTEMILRPIQPMDGDQAEVFRGKLSTQSIYARFLGYIPSTSQKLIDRLTNIDYAKEMAIVAEAQNKNENEKEVIAIGRIAGEQDLGADFAIIIADDWQGRGLGSILTEYMIEIAIDMKFSKIYASVFSTNTRMLEILRQKGFTIRKDDYTTYYAELILPVGDK